MLAHPERGLGVASSSPTTPISHTMIERKGNEDGGFADRYDGVLAVTHMFTKV